MSTIPDWKSIFGLLREYTEEETPSVSLIAEEGGTPFRILVSTIISLRTRDDVTLRASRALFALADTPRALLDLEEESIINAIFPCGFYKTKAKQLREISQIILDQHQGEVPNNREALLALPGVGQKTANLVLGLAFGVHAICVDTHVHRISNRAGWIQTKTPDESELALQKILPEEYWIELNELLVVYGQEICTPASPKCSHCSLKPHCSQVGVVHAR